MTAGCSSAAAVPLVVTTAAGRPPAKPRPRAKNPAERSSSRKCSRSAPRPAAWSSAKSSGVERDPGQTTTSRTPARAHSSTSTAAKAAWTSWGRAAPAGPAAPLTRASSRSCERPPAQRHARAHLMGASSRDQAHARAPPRLHPDRSLLAAAGPAPAGPLRPVHARCPRARPFQRCASQPLAGCRPAGGQAGGPGGGRGRGTVARARPAESAAQARGAAWAGYSMGGRLALHVALAHPEVVTRLVLISTNPGIEGPQARQARQASDEALAARVEREGVGPFLDWWLSQPLFATLPPTAAGRQERLANTAEGLAWSLRLAGLGRQEPLQPRLAELGRRRLPVLLITGELDTAYCRHAEQMAEAIGPTARHLVVGSAGHACHLERPDEVAEALAAFCQTS